MARYNRLDAKSYKPLAIIVDTLAHEPMMRRTARLKTVLLDYEQKSEKIIGAEVKYKVSRNLNQIRFRPNATISFSVGSLGLKADDSLIYTFCEYTGERGYRLCKAVGVPLKESAIIDFVNAFAQMGDPLKISLCLRGIKHLEEDEPCTTPQN